MHFAGWMISNKYYRYYIWVTFVLLWNYDLIEIRTDMATNMETTLWCANFFFERENPKGKQKGTRKKELGEP